MSVITVSFKFLVVKDKPQNLQTKALQWYKSLRQKRHKLLPNIRYNSVGCRGSVSNSHNLKSVVRSSTCICTEMQMHAHIHTWLCSLLASRGHTVCLSYPSLSLSSTLLVCLPLFLLPSFTFRSIRYTNGSNYRLSEVIYLIFLKYTKEAEIGLHA